MNMPRDFAAAPFFVLRTPSLPYDFQGAWGTELQAVAAEPETLAPALAADAEALRARLKEAVLRPEIREALFLASPDLESNLEPWCRGELTAARGRRVEQSLIRYLTRMSSRATPFGLFAGCSLGAWGTSSRLPVGPWGLAQRRTRLDMDFRIPMNGIGTTWASKC